MSQAWLRRCPRCGAVLTQAGKAGALALRLRMARTMKHETERALTTFEAAWDRAQREQAQHAPRRHGITRMETRLLAAQVARKVVAAAQRAVPPPPAPPATEGRGWKVLEQPRVSHQALEEHARKVWSFTWHGLPWPQGWRVRWGKLHAGLLTLSGASMDTCADLLFGTVVGLCVMSPKIILIDKENQRGRTPRQFATTVLHELLHTQLRDAGHGPGFQAALKSATNYYFGEEEARP